jgi:hypothetical protein
MPFIKFDSMTSVVSDLISIMCLCSSVHMVIKISQRLNRRQLIREHQRYRESARSCCPAFTCLPTSKGIRINLKEAEAEDVQSEDSIFLKRQVVRRDQQLQLRSMTSPFQGAAARTFCRPRQINIDRLIFG